LLIFAILLFDYSYYETSPADIES